MDSPKGLSLFENAEIAAAQPAGTSLGAAMTWTISFPQDGLASEPPEDSGSFALEIGRFWSHGAQ
jgi:hypothetical protein